MADREEEKVEEEQDFFFKKKLDMVKKCSTLLHCVSALCNVDGFYCRGIIMVVSNAGPI